MPTPKETAAAEAAVRAYLVIAINDDAPSLFRHQAQEGLASEHGSAFVAGLTATCLGAAEKERG